MNVTGKSHGPKRYSNTRQRTLETPTQSSSQPQQQLPIIIQQQQQQPSAPPQQQQVKIKINLFS